MKVSHSRIECFKNCPYQYFLRYVKQLKTIKDQDASNALYLGTAVHTLIEKGLDDAIENYTSNYYVLTDKNVDEIVKLDELSKKVNVIPQGVYEMPIQREDFIGYADLLVPIRFNQFDLYDFKYSNNKEHYIQSPQLSIYKYFIDNGGIPEIVVRDMYYVFIPKCQLRQKQNESIYQFRKRIKEYLDGTDIEIVKVDYNQSQVDDFLKAKKDLESATEFPKTPNRLCKWCEFNGYCQESEDYMLLPKNERRSTETITKRKIWIYGQAFSGKTTMLDKAPSPLNLNTDGNINFVTMPYISIKDEVTVEGRITKRKYAWEVFKDTITELEKKENDFKTIIVDLVEDTREMCRLYEYNHLGIEHESDSSYGKGWDIIKTEYLSTMRRFFNLDYENLVIVSHEIQNDISLKNGTKITTIKPNLQDAISNKLAGMVDMVGRIIIQDNGERIISFKSNEYIFGGGRINKNIEIPLSWEELVKVYDGFKLEDDPKPAQTTTETKEETTTETTTEPVPPVRRTRKVRNTEEGK